MRYTFNPIPHSYKNAPTPLWQKKTREKRIRTVATGLFSSVLLCVLGTQFNRDDGFVRLFPTSIWWWKFPRGAGSICPYPLSDFRSVKHAIVMNRTLCVYCDLRFGNCHEMGLLWFWCYMDWYRLYVRSLMLGDYEIVFRGLSCRGKALMSVFEIDSRMIVFVIDNKLLSIDLIEMV